MPIQLAPMRPGDADELGRICYEAFKNIADKHGFPPDFPSVEVARGLLASLVQREDCYCVAARWDDRLVGSNFMALGDDVGGVGPVSVDVGTQGQAVGRRLMEALVTEADRLRIARVRLLQDGFNMTSLSLYASVGFDVKLPVALLQTVPAATPDPTIRSAQAHDVPALAELCRRLYKVSRQHEIASTVSSGALPLLRELGGRITGYLIPRGRGGHGVMETEDDAVALIGAAATQPFGGQVFCPLPYGDLFRRLLQGGCRVIKVMNLMALGPYEAPDGVCLPSILY